MRETILLTTKKETNFLTICFYLLGFFLCFQESLLLESSLCVFIFWLFARRQTLLYPLATYFFLWMIFKHISFFNWPIIYFLLPWLGAIIVSRVFHVPFPLFPLGEWKSWSVATWWKIVVIIVASFGALFYWHRYYYDPISSEGIIHILRPYPSSIIFGVILPSFAFLNAAFEEWLYRSVILQTLLCTCKKIWLAIILQGLWFGAAHYLYGFPNGWIGFAMASVYGIALGVVAWETKGTFVSFCIHIFADVTIGFYILS